MKACEVFDAEKEAEARRAYHRAWRKAHPDQVKAAQKRFYAKLAAQRQGGEKVGSA